jgi:outer membrane beta-barrel protein
MRKELALTLLALAPLAAAAQTPPQKPANEQVIVPQVERRDVKLPKFPSKDFEVGVFAGTYSTQDFGAHVVGGLRLGYHITEDIFVEGVYAQTKVSDEQFRQILPSGIFPTETIPLKYYNLSAGFNVLPGEVFIGSKWAMASALYVIGGVGATNFNQKRHQTVNVGFGLRVLATDRFAVQLDVRDHIFTVDLLGKRRSTQNLEATMGVTLFF